MSASFDPSGTFIAVADEPTVVVDARSGDEVLTLEETWSSIVEWSPDGTSIATAGADPRIFISDDTPIAIGNGGARIFDARTGLPRSPRLGRWPSDDLAFSADGSRLATGNIDGTVHIWDTDTGEQELVLRSGDTPDEQGGLAFRPGSIAFSPDGTKLLQASADGPVWTWPLDLDELMTFIKGNLTRTLTDDECQQYMHLDRCP